MSIHVSYDLSISQLPVECVEDCSGPGPADDAVSYWADRLKFTVDRARAITCLRGYGAWEPEELEASPDEQLSHRILWLACGNFSEFITEAEREGLDPYEDCVDFEPSSGSDVFVLE